MSYGSTDSTCRNDSRRQRYKMKRYIRQNYNRMLNDSSNNLADSPLYGYNTSASNCQKFDW